MDKFKNAVKHILLQTDIIMVRDNASKKIAQEWTQRDDVTVSEDLARKYVLGRHESVMPSPNNALACFLREWTHEYNRELSKEDFDVKKIEFESSLAHLIKTKADELKVEKIKFYHMHNFCVGNDDRDFSRKFIKRYFSKDNRVSYDKQLSTVDSVLLAMKSSQYNICMRFHSVLFAHTLGVNFSAIDYTLGGKIHGYLKDNNRLDAKVIFKEIVNQAQ